MNEDDLPEDVYRCDECGHIDEQASFMDFDEELTFVNSRCPECGHYDIS